MAETMQKEYSTNTETDGGVLDRVDRRFIILNAHRQLFRKYKGQPLWSFISETCGVGSTSAIEICRECGWNPHQDGAVRLSFVESA